jgi:DNA-binding winged helix-turn-helix (wHTH) protein
VLEPRSDGALKLHNASRTVRFSARSAKLPELTFRLLRLLAARAPAIVPFADIEAEVWAAQVSRETLKQRAKLLRDALTALGAPANAIEAVRNEGYRLHLAATASEEPSRPRIPAPLLGAFLALAAIAVLPLLTQHAVAEPLSLTIESEPSAGPLRRALIRNLALLDAIEVIDAPDLAGDLVISVAMESDTRASLQLRDGRSGAVLLAEAYVADPEGYDRAVAHFANFVHERAQALSPRGRLPADLAALYSEAAELLRGGDEGSLLLARAKLRTVLARAPQFLMGRALLARTEADLTLRFNHPPALSARAEAARLVAAHPNVPEFRYTLARTELAVGNRPAALDQLRIAERDLPFLRRDVQALERLLIEPTT